MRIVHHPNIVELKAFYYFDGDRVRDTDVRTVWKVELSAFRALARLLFDSGFYFPHCPERDLPTKTRYAIQMSRQCIK